MNQAGQRLGWFKVAVGVGTALGVLLLVQSVITYYQVSEDLVTAELQREARWRVTELEREVLRLGIQDPGELSQVVGEIRQEEPKKIAWIRVIDMAAQTVVQSGNPIGPPFKPEQLQLANERGAPVSDIRHTDAGKVLVTAFAVRFAPRRVGQTGQLEPAPAPGPRFSRRFVEMALYWDSASQAFTRLRTELITSLFAAAGLVGAMALLWSRFPRYLQGIQLRQQTELARAVQSELLPAKDSTFENLDFAAELIPAWQVGGDFYDVFYDESGRLAIVVGDVSGDGLPAAVMAGVVHGAVRAIGWLDGTAQHEAASRNLGELLRARTASNEFVSLFWCYYEPGERVLRYINAGHPPPLLLRSSTDRGVFVERLEEGGPILGVVPSAQYRQGRVPICPGDLLLLYSDGVTEAANAEDEEFGEERLIELLHEMPRATATDIRDEILRRVRKFVGHEQFQDDLTLLVARFQPPHSISKLQN